MKRRKGREKIVRIVSGLKHRHPIADQKKSSFEKLDIENRRISLLLSTPRLLLPPTTPHASSFPFTIISPSLYSLHSTQVFTVTTPAPLSNNG